ncbi:hypothetical protein BBUCA112A_KI0060 (plasmid) [Borreliella burgdorferi CA-11.2A]|nr:hypothetical protein BBU72A_I0021 [Borreliella burgdorferi 72a]ACN56182.1 hypothetical protein BBUCA112A_KI0060 [Borreliella burgdorferi CA-11.2A]
MVNAFCILILLVILIFINTFIAQYLNKSKYFYKKIIKINNLLQCL